MRTPEGAFDMALIGDGEARRGALGIEDTGVASAGERGHEGRVSLAERTLLLGCGWLAWRRWIVTARRAAVARHVEGDRAGFPRQRQGRRLRDDVPGNERRKQKYPDQRECARQSAVPMEVPQPHTRIIGSPDHQGKRAVAPQ